MFFNFLQKRLGKAQLNYHFNFSFKHRYLYVQTSKCACTYLKSGLSFAELSSGGFWSDTYKHTDPNIVFRDAMVPSPHLPANRSVFIKPYQLSAEQFDNFIGNSANFKFAVVRNPFQRILSSYLDTALNDRLPFHSLKPELAIIKGISENEVSGKNVSFQEFLTAIRESLDKSGWSSIDQHYREQSFHISDDLIDYSRIYRLEKVEDLGAELSSVLGINFRTTNHGGHLTNSEKHTADYYSDKACIRLVEQLYENDLKRFNYQFPSL